MLSAITYLTLGALLARSHQRRALKVYFLLLAVLLTLMVGVSRVYLGVHWPTDVLAGWTAGAVWALLCWLVARRLQRRHSLELEAEHTERTQQLRTTENWHRRRSRVTEVWLCKGSFTVSQ